MQPQSLHPLLGFVHGNDQVDALVQSYQFGAGYDHDWPYDTLDADWALLKLTAPLPAGHPTLPHADALPNTNTPVMTGGYGKDRAFMMTLDARCRVRQVMAQRLLFNDCRTVHGYSGSPLLQLLPDRLEVVGVNVGISTVDGAPMAIGRHRSRTGNPYRVATDLGARRRGFLLGDFLPGALCPLRCLISSSNRSTARRNRPASMLLGTLRLSSAEFIRLSRS